MNCIWIAHPLASLIPSQPSLLLPSQSFKISKSSQLAKNRWIRACFTESKQLVSWDNDDLNAWNQSRYNLLIIRSLHQAERAFLALLSFPQPWHSTTRSFASWVRPFAGSVTAPFPAWCSARFEYFHRFRLMSLAPQPSTLVAVARRPRYRCAYPEAIVGR